MMPAELSLKLSTNRRLQPPLINNFLLKMAWHVNLFSRRLFFFHMALQSKWKKMTNYHAVSVGLYFK
jgi:hypothetical protein